MIIVGAGSAGKETSGILIRQSNSDIVFFDIKEKQEVIWNKYKVISSISDLKKQININPDFCIAIGNPRKRKKMFDMLIKNGGRPCNVVSENSTSLSKIKSNCSIIQPGVCISYDVIISDSCIIHSNSVIGHKVKIGKFVNISPLSTIIGPCIIDNFSYISSGCIIMPNIKIGKNVYVTPGRVVNKNLKDYETF